MNRINLPGVRPLSNNVRISFRLFPYSISAWNRAPKNKAVARLETAEALRDVRRALMTWAYDKLTML